jgi:hypothetical protein
MIIEEFQRAIRGVPTHIVTAILNSYCQGIDWRGCTKKMICEDLFTYHQRTAATINVQRFTDALIAEEASLVRRREKKVKQVRELYKRDAENAKLHETISVILPMVPNLQPLSLAERQALSLFIQKHLPHNYQR